MSAIQLPLPIEPVLGMRARSSSVHVLNRTQAHSGLLEITFTAHDHAVTSLRIRFPVISIDRE